MTSVYGNQQRAKVGFNPKKKGRKSYHPLMDFIGETRDFIKVTLRPGDRHTSYDARGFVASIIRTLPVKVRRLRANCENMIKEGIYSFGMDNIVSHEYSGNVFWFQKVA